jgi:hypothetical protein
VGAWQEVRVRWYRIQQEEKSEARSLEWFGAAIVVAGYNTHDRGRSATQWGGVKIVAWGDLSHIVCKKGVDPIVVDLL